MTTPSKRRQVIDALAVRWTPALAARVQRRVGEALVRRRRRRRTAILGLALLLIGGASFAFTRARDLFRRRQASATAHASLLWPRIAPEVRPPRAPEAPPAAGSIPGSNTSRQPTAPASLPGAPPRTASHRRLAARNLPPSASPTAPVTVSSLFAASDAARLGGRPVDAVGPLTEIVTRFPLDSRAAIAAFQLGRVLADELHQPAAAARAFERARDLAPGGPLAKDATVRASEARRAIQPSERTKAP